MFRLNKKNYKRSLVVGLLIAIFALGLSGCSSKAKEGVVATVDGMEITEEEFNREYEVQKVAAEKQYGADILTQEVEDGQVFEEKMKEDIIEMLILEKLIFKEAEKMDITVSDEEIQKEMDLVIEGIGGEEKFEEHLEGNELSREYLENLLKKQILFGRYGEAFVEEITIEDKDSKEYFEENKEFLNKVKASHILVQEEEKGNEIMGRLENGEEFEAIAMTESMDDGSAIKGGDLGYFSKGSMIAEFEEVAFSLEPGEISDLVKTEVGYHIIRLDDKKDSYEDLEEEIKQTMRDQKYQEKIYELRENAKVEFFGEFDKKEEEAE